MCVCVCVCVCGKRKQTKVHISVVFSICLLFVLFFKPTQKF